MIVPSGTVKIQVAQGGYRNSPMNESSIWEKIAALDPNMGDTGVAGTAEPATPPPAPEPGTQVDPNAISNAVNQGNTLNKNMPGTNAPSQQSNIGHLFLELQETFKKSLYVDLIPQQGRTIRISPRPLKEKVTKEQPAATPPQDNIAVSKDMQQTQMPQQQEPMPEPKIQHPSFQQTLKILASDKFLNLNDPVEILGNDIILSGKYGRLKIDVDTSEMSDDPDAWVLMIYREAGGQQMVEKPGKNKGKRR